MQAPRSRSGLHHLRPSPGRAGTGAGTEVGHRGAGTKPEGEATKPGETLAPQAQHLVIVLKDSQSP